MPKIFTNTRAGLITIAFVAIEPGAQAQIPSDETFQRWKDEHEAHQANPAKDKGPGPGTPAEREIRLLEKVAKSSVVRARHLVEGKVTLPEPVVNPGAIVVTSNKPASLLEFEPMRALALIQMETSLEQLATWAKVETRPDVMARIKSRADNLAALK